MRHWSDMSFTIAIIESSPVLMMVGPNTMARLRTSICKAEQQKTLVLYRVLACDYFRVVNLYGDIPLTLKTLAEQCLKHSSIMYVTYKTFWCVISLRVLTNKEIVMDSRGICSLLSAIG